jgi:hypothetical protein
VASRDLQVSAKFPRELEETESGVVPAHESDQQLKAASTIITTKIHSAS